MKNFIWIFVFSLVISVAFGKGGSKGGGSGQHNTNNGAQHGSSDTHSNSNSGTHSNGGGSPPDSHTNGGTHSNGSPSQPNGAHGSSGGSHSNQPTSHPNAVSHTDNKQKSSSGKTALAGGLLAGGLLGYAAGSHSHGSHKNSSECNKRKLPSAVNETSCCPGIPPQMELDTSCGCEKNDTKKYASCVIECTLENEGWLDGNGTIDNELTIESVLNKTKDESLWKNTVTSIVNECFKQETPQIKHSAIEVPKEHSQLDIMICITQKLIRHCPKDVKVDSKHCKKFFKFVNSCEDYPFLD